MGAAVLTAACGGTAISEGEGGGGTTSAGGGSSVGGGSSMGGAPGQGGGVGVGGGPSPGGAPGQGGSVGVGGGSSVGGGPGQGGAPGAPLVSCVPSTLESVVGDYWLGVRLSVAPQSPAYAITTLKSGPPVNGQFDIFLEGTPIELMTGLPAMSGNLFGKATTNFDPFKIFLPEVVIPPAANPVISAEAELEITLFNGFGFCDANSGRLLLICGEVSGRAHRPVELDLAGSSFVMQRPRPGEPVPPPLRDCPPVDFNN